MEIDRITYFQRAAEQRLFSAEVLLRNARYHDAIYLGGYAVECSLKAVILAGVASNVRDAYKRRYFHGKMGHDLERLQEMLLTQGLHRPPVAVMQRIHEMQWHTELRYEASSSGPRDATGFCQDAAKIVRWMNRSIENVHRTTDR